MVETSTSLSPHQPIFTQHYFQVGALSLFARRYGERGGQPVIALHGWMDNCASFEQLAEKLKGCDLLCLDCAGHGLSDHRPHLGAYNIWQDVAEVFAVADQLGWQQFTLLGHSRGAICSFLAAGTLPERISKLVLIEGFYPPVSTEDACAENLSAAVMSLLATEGRKKRYYSDFQGAVVARMQGLVPVCDADARALAKHGTVASENGYYWRNDHRLSVGSEVRLTLAQVRSFQKRITAKTLVIIANQGLLTANPKLIAAIEAFDLATVRYLDGDHHLHMHGSAEHVARYIQNFLSD